MTVLELKELLRKSQLDSNIDFKDKDFDLKKAFEEFLKEQVQSEDSDHTISTDR